MLSSAQRQQNTAAHRRTHLVCSCGVGEVEYLNVAFGRSDDEKGILDVHRITSFWELNRRHGVGTPQIPVLPRPSATVHANKKEHAFTLSVLSQLPVANIPPCGVSIHLTTLMGASCWATCCGWPVVTSNMRAALSAPPDITLLPS